MISAKLGSRGYEWKKQYVVEIPIIQITEAQQHLYSKIAEILIEMHKEEIPDEEKINYFDRTIADNLVYELYFFEDRQLRELVARHLDGEIGCIYRGLVSDNEVAERIGEIQNHRYVQVIEDKS